MDRSLPSQVLEMLQLTRHLAKRLSECLQGRTLQVILNPGAYKPSDPPDRRPLQVLAMMQKSSAVFSAS